MTKNDFLNEMRDYIDSFVGTFICGMELAKWIKEDSADFGLDLTDQQIGWLVEEIESCEWKEGE